jgi:hypothetical protein
MNTASDSYIACGFPLATLSTGRIIAVGIHSYSSEVNPDGTQKDRADHSPMSEVEETEAWALVNARLAERRAAR